MHQFCNLQSSIKVEEKVLDNFLAFIYLVKSNLFYRHFQCSLFMSFLSIYLNLHRLQMNTNLLYQQQILVIKFLQSCLFVFFHIRIKIILVSRIHLHRNYKDDHYLLMQEYEFHHKI